jgi:Uma2 family endonuclease
MQPLRRPATYADLEALPEGVHAEILDGQIVTFPSPLPRHAKCAGAVRRFVGGPFDDDDGFGGPGGWWIFVEVDVALGEEVFRPDLSGWRRARLPEPDVRPIAVPPDWVCEVLSPSNEPHDRVTKKRKYAKYGIGHYWIIDPEERTLEAFDLVGGKWVDAGSFGETEVARIRPFEAVELPVGRLFLPRKTEAGREPG